MLDSYDEIEVLAEMKGKLDRCEVASDDVVIELMHSIGERVEGERREPSMNGFDFLIEELGSVAKLIKLLLSAGVYPYKSVDFDGETFYAGEVGDYHSGCLVHRYMLYSSWVSGGYGTTYSVPKKRILSRYFLEGFNASRDKVLVRELLGGSKGCELRVINVSKKGTISVNSRNDFCMENGLGDYCVQDYPGVISDQVSGEGRIWLNDEADLFARVSGENVTLRRFLDLRAKYFRNRLLYRDLCEDYRAVNVYHARRVRGIGSYMEYPKNSDYFGGEPDVDLFSVKSLRNVIAKLKRRIKVYPEIFELMEKRDWETLESKFPDGEIVAFRRGDLY